MKAKQLIRANFRAAVFGRDGGKCAFCAETENLDAHHITDRSLMPNGGYVAENGISLCPAHHLSAEKYHMTDGREWDEGMHPADLYARIGSSLADALAASRKI